MYEIKTLKYIEQKIVFSRLKIKIIQIKLICLKFEVTHNTIHLSFKSYNIVNSKPYNLL